MPLLSAPCGCRRFRAPVRTDLYLCCVLFLMMLCNAFSLSACVCWRPCAVDCWFVSYGAAASCPSKVVYEELSHLPEPPPMPVYIGCSPLPIAKLHCSELISVVDAGDTTPVVRLNRCGRPPDDVLDPYALKFAVLPRAPSSRLIMFSYAGCRHCLIYNDYYCELCCDETGFICSVTLLGSPFGDR